MKKLNILRLVLISALIGSISGLVIGAFMLLLEKAVDLNLNHSFLIYILPLFGLLTTFVYKNYGKNSKRGNNLIIENVNGSDETIPFRMAPLIFVSTIFTHLFGGSVGREGTAVQICGTISNYFAKLFKKTGLDRKVLLLSGISAGFSSVFGTPIAGTIFALEMTKVGSFSYVSMIPALTSAIFSVVVAKLVGVHHSTYNAPSLEAFNGLNMLRVIIISICFGLAARLFIFAIHFIKDTLGKYFKSDYTRIFIGGVLMIAATLLIGNNTYNNLSVGLLKGAFSGNVPTFAFLLKLLLTALCLGSGFQGGEVTPLFIIGGTLGATLASIFGLPLALSVTLGFICVFAGATNTPITSFILYVELFGTNNILFAIIACMISVFISGKSCIYSSQLWLDEEAEFKTN